MTNQECMADLERITEVNKLKEQQAILKEEYIILKMKEEVSNTPITIARTIQSTSDIAKLYLAIEAEINKLMST